MNVKPVTLVRFERGIKYGLRNSLEQARAGLVLKTRVRMYDYAFVAGNLSGPGTFIRCAQRLPPSPSERRWVIQGNPNHEKLMSGRRSHGRLSGLENGGRPETHEEGSDRSYPPNVRETSRPAQGLYSRQTSQLR